MGVQKVDLYSLDVIGVKEVIIRVVRLGRTENREY